MAQAIKKNTNEDTEDFVLMGRTRALLSEIWDHWQKNLGHTPEVAKKMMDAAIEELHAAEISGTKKAKAKKTAVKKKVQKAVKSLKSKAKKAVKFKAKKK